MKYFSETPPPTPNFKPICANSYYLMWTCAGFPDYC